MPGPTDLLEEFRAALARQAWNEARALEERIADSARGLPIEPAALTQVGHLYAEHWRYAEADAALSRAAALDPGEPGTESIGAFVKQELGDVAGALRGLERAERRFPRDLRSAVAHRLLLPQVYDDVADVSRWRQRYERGLDDLTSRLDAWDPRQVFDLDRGNFLLAYQGEDDRELQRRYSSFLAALAAKADPGWLAPRKPRPAGRRVRVGFVGSLFRDCTAGRYFERWATGLDSMRFERVLYHTGPIDDDFTRRIAQAVEHFVPLRATIREIATRLRADELDALVYPEVGMDAATYLLAALRLAPLQLAGWGHPVTTGSDAIDGFFTCAAMEPRDGASHYVERLLPLPGLGVDYPMPPRPGAATRADFSLPEGKRLYICAQSLFKIHPEMDALFAELLASDTEGVLVLFQAGAPAVTQKLGARLQRALAARGVAPRGQLKLLPRVGAETFRRALSLADVVLDTVRWSGGNTSLDAFVAGAPVVTMPGRFMRGRQTAAMLRLMELDELVVETPGDYVRIALEVARDPGTLRERVRARAPRLFNQAQPLEAFAEALERLARARG